MTWAIVAILVSLVAGGGLGWWFARREPAARTKAERLRRAEEAEERLAQRRAELRQDHERRTEAVRTKDDARALIARLRLQREQAAERRRRRREEP